MEKGQKIEKYFWQEKEKPLLMEKTALKNTCILKLFNEIISQQLIIVNLNQLSNFEFFYVKKIRKYIKDIVLFGEWMK